MIDRRKFLIAFSSTAAIPGIANTINGNPFLTPENRANLATDPLRPQFHFLAPANWMNDPNGPIFWKGLYHMFYQYNPDGAFWGDMHWGHAISKDMVHWKHLPIALAPTTGGTDSAGCFTGTALVDGGKVYMMYTGVRDSSKELATSKSDGGPSFLESQCLAASNDSDLRTWIKTPYALIPNPPSGLLVNGFRDPSPWRQDNWWYTVVGSGVANRGGAVLLYRSRDLHHWEFMHILAERDRGPVNPWEAWECPEFFTIGEWHVLIFSTLGKAYWRCGKLDREEMTFRAECEGILDYGSYYAPKTQLDGDGNRILWGWIKETRPLEEYKAAGWAGMTSLPRVITVTSQGQLRITFARQVERIRQAEETVQIGLDETTNLREISSLALRECCGEILLHVDRPSAPIEASFVGDNEVAPWLRITYDPVSPAPVSVDARPIPVEFTENQNLELHIYVDGSVIELLVNGQVAWTKRFYYSGRVAKTLRLKWSGSTRPIRHLSFWQISPISADRLTT
jgi:beta-fructofuranosidase